MKKQIGVAIAIVTVGFNALIPNLSLAQSSRASAIDRSATQALTTLYKNRPGAKALGDKAVAVLIFPNIVKGGFIIAGQFGDGALRRGGKTVAYYRSLSASYGFQAGAQAFGYVLFFMDEGSVEYLDRSGGWELGTGPSLVVLFDPESVRAADAAGVGARLSLRMGGKADDRHGPPLEAEATVIGLSDGRFEELIDEAGSGVAAPHTSRGCAFGDFDNDGDMDILVMNMNEPPSLLRNDVTGSGHWIKVKLECVKSNRSAIGSRVLVHAGARTEAQAVVSQSSFYSANDPRLHFGLGAVATVSLEIFWPSGVREVIPEVAANQLVTVREGAGIVANQKFGKA